MFRDEDGNLDWRLIGYRSRSALAVALSLTVLLGAGFFVYRVGYDAYLSWRTADDYIGEGTSEVEVSIPQGSNGTKIGDLLVEAGVIRGTRAFVTAIEKQGVGEKLQHGRYKLKKQLPAETALNMMLDPANRSVLRVSFPEGTTLLQQNKRIVEQLGIDEKDVVKATTVLDGYQLPEYANGSLEGVLFPATYDVSEPPQSEAVVKTQLDQFRKVAEELDFEAKAEALGYTPREVLIAASIIQREVSREEDMPMVAAVIYNRLEIGQKLEMDSTVHYALNKYGRVSTSDEDRKTDSPYNTYLYPGLPAGPISNPGKVALQAALNPAETEALYFVAVNLETGETVFANTFEEHEANHQRLIEYCKSSDLC